MKIRTDYTHEQVENLVRMAHAATMNKGLGPDAAQVLGRYIQPFIDRDAELVEKMFKTYYGQSPNILRVGADDRLLADMHRVLALVREHDKANPPAQ